MLYSKYLFCWDFQISNTKPEFHEELYAPLSRYRYLVSMFATEFICNHGFLSATWPDKKLCYRKQIARQLRIQYVKV